MRDCSTRSSISNTPGESGPALPMSPSGDLATLYAFNAPPQVMLSMALRPASFSMCLTCSHRLAWRKNRRRPPSAEREAAGSSAALASDTICTAPAFGFPCPVRCAPYKLTNSIDFILFSRRTSTLQLFRDLESAFRYDDI